MSKRIWSIALAYVGVMIGAGVSSGQGPLAVFCQLWSLGSDRCYCLRSSTCWFWPFDDCSGKLLSIGRSFGRSC